MSEYMIQTIPVDQVCNNMILAEDVYNDMSMLLLPQGTEINDRTIIKLKMYGVEYVMVKKFYGIEYVRQAAKPSISVQNKPRVQEPIRQREEFQKFEAAYEKNQEHIQEQILSISEGKNVNVTELFSVSEGMMSNMTRTGDLFAFLHNLQGTDDYTYSHSINVSLLANVFGKWLGFGEEDIKGLTVAGLLHDIGKTKISLQILNKPGKLTTEEYEEIKKHTVYGFRLLEKQDISMDIKMAVLMHHEKADGTGYPMGAKGPQINQYAKVVAIADIYDAMTSKRAYREKLCPFHVIRTFEQECYGKLDTEFLMAFLQNIAYYYLGSWVRLSSGEEGEIVFINQQNLSKPIVKIDNELVDLRQEDMEIEQVL